MCILLLSTAHPKYALIVLSNRDEYLHRATSRATFWPPPHTHILSGRDLARPEHGTWMGITRHGRIAILTNFREASSSAAISQTSRGAMVNAFLSAKPHDLDPEEWIGEIARSLTEGYEGEDSEREEEGRRELETKVGGFSLVCGVVRGDGKGGIKPLRVISNRDLKRRVFIPTSPSSTEGKACEGDEQPQNELEAKLAYGLSNSLIHEPWPKVTIGEQLLADTIKASDGTEAEWDQDELLTHLFAVLSHNTFPMPPPDDVRTGKDWGYKEQLEALRHSVFIPPFETASEATPPAPETPPHSESPEPHRSASVTLSQLDLPVPPAGIASSTASTHGSIRSTTPIPSPPSETHSSPPTPTGEAPKKVNQKMPGTEKSTIYGTQKQTVILVDHEGHVTYVERTLFDEDAKPLQRGEADVREEFDIEGW